MRKSRENELKRHEAEMKKYEAEMKDFREAKERYEVEREKALELEGKAEHSIKDTEAQLARGNILFTWQPAHESDVGTAECLAREASEERKKQEESDRRLEVELSLYALD